LVGSTVGVCEAVGVGVIVADGVGVWVKVAVKVGVSETGTNGVLVAVEVALGVKVSVGLAPGRGVTRVGEAEGLAVGVSLPGARRMAIRPAQ